MFKFTTAWLFFLLSPILSIPLILKDIYYRKQNAYILITILFAIASYLYIPSFMQDKAYYFELHEMFNHMDLKGVTVYLMNERTDFFFYLIIYVFAKLGFSFSFTSAIITGITVYLMLYVLRSTLKKYNLNNSISLYFFIMLIASFSLPEFFSGMRFYLAASFVVMGLYKSVIEKKTKNGIIYLLLAPFIHFGTAIYLPFIIIYLISRRNTSLLKVFFLSSFIFLFVPKELFSSLIDVAGLTGVYLSKADSYLVGNDFIQNSLEVGNFNNYIRILFDQIWYYIAGMYLIYRINEKNEYMSIMMIAYSINNIFNIVPTVFGRYSLITVILFVLLLIHDRAISKKDTVLRNLFFVLLVITSIFDTIALREVFYKSYFKLEVLTLPSIIIFEPVSSIDNIYKH